MLHVPTAVGRLGRVRSSPFYERCAGLGELVAPALLPVAAARPARARALAGRDLGRRRQHREHARDLARARLRRDPARGVGERRRPLRRERRDDLLVRGGRDRLVRAAARGHARRARLPRRQRVPALRRRGAAPAALPRARRRRLPGRASRPTTASGSTTSAPSCARSSPAGPGAAAYRVTRDGEERLEAHDLVTACNTAAQSPTGILDA